MADIGLVASIIGVAGAGAKLSLILYQFAEIVGGAANEVRGIAGDISIFCSVLHQLDATLQGAEFTRYSQTAIATVTTIVDECRHIFTQIQGVVDRLKRESVDTPQELTLAWTARVKWVFQRSKVTLYQSKLESMKTTLLLMLTTMAMAKRVSVAQFETLTEDSEETLAQSLVITQQVALDKLRMEEGEMLVNDFSKEDEVLIPSCTNMGHLKIPGQPNGLRDYGIDESPARKKRNRSSQIVRGQIAGPELSSDLQLHVPAKDQFNTDRTISQLTASNTAFSHAMLFTPNKRGSVDSNWLSEAVFNDGLTSVERHQSLVNVSTVTLANQLIKSLLSRWIDQSRMASSPTIEVKVDKSPIKTTNDIPKSKSPLWRKTPTSPQAPPSSPDHLDQVPAHSLPVAHVFRNTTLKLNLHDKRDVVLLKYLRMFNHSADPDGYTLSIEYDQEDTHARIEEEISPHTHPLIMFNVKSKRGAMPHLLLRKKGAEGDSKLWTKRIVSLDGVA